MRMFGASGGNRRACSRRWWVDSASVKPAVLADGVGGKGSTDPSTGVVFIIAFHFYSGVGTMP